MTPVIAGGSAPRLVDGRFELLQRLGGGGMGVVWRARDTALHRDVALKEVLPPDPAAGQADPVEEREVRQRVLREARALAQLRHPNVVIIHHIIDTREHPHPWLVMELVTGGSLADRLERGPLTVAEAARIGRGVLGALRAAHAVGILHRDIKPGNVLLRQDGSPVLTDFGIAAVSDVTALTRSGTLVGSPEYVAPERLRGQEGNPASDLWSLGMMLYVAVEGRHPLRRATVLATLTAVLDEPLPPPVNAGPLAPALAAVLAKDPRVRPTAEQFDRLLAGAEYSLHPAPIASPAWQESHSSGTSITIPNLPRVPRPPGTGGVPLPGKRRGRTALIALSVVALLVAGGLTWFLLPRPTASGGSPVTLGASHSGQRTTGRAIMPTTSATQPAPRNLLTPDGIRTTITAITRAMGPKILQLNVYGDYATAETATAADPKVYDNVRYRNGVVSHSPGGEVDATLYAPIDMSVIDWNVLPGLLTKAQTRLNVPHPTLIYVIVDSDMNITDSGDTTLTPVIRVYRTDDYRTGMLVADLKGNVLTTAPAS